MSDRSFPYPSASSQYCINLNISINAGGRSTCHGNGKQKYFENLHAGEETNTPVVLLQRLNKLEMSPKTTSQIANQSNQRTTVRLLMTALMHTDTEILFEKTNKLHTTFSFANARDHKICAMNNFFRWSLRLSGARAECTHANSLRSVQTMDGFGLKVSSRKVWKCTIKTERTILKLYNTIFIVASEFVFAMVLLKVQEFEVPELNDRFSSTNTIFSFLVFQNVIFPQAILNSF